MGDLLIGIGCLVIGIVLIVIGVRGMKRNKVK